MKRTFVTFISALILFAMTAPAFALSSNEIAGKYLITSKLIGISSLLNLDTDGNIDIAEQSGKFTCQGTSELILKKVTALVKCSTGASFKLIVNLNKVEDLTSFTAPIKISIPDTRLGTENQWDFKKLND